MSGSTFGTLFKITTFGESHGTAIGVIVDGCPAGLPLCEKDIQADLNRRKPGVSEFATKRNEADECQIVSGVFEGMTTGTPITVIIYNTDQRSKDYGNIAKFYRPGHADYCYDEKYGLRDYRGGGRSSGRETAARVMAGAIARKILASLHISVQAYTTKIGPVEINMANFNREDRFNNPLVMPDAAAYKKAAAYLSELMEKGDSAGGICQCVIKGVRPGIGQPVFDKLDAQIAKAVMSIGAVKGIAFGAGFKAAELTGSINNDNFYMENAKVMKSSNNAGGILGGLSDGHDIVFNAVIKPTPSVSILQKSIGAGHENMEMSIKGRHDPVIVPRAIVVVEAMAAIALTDLLLQNMTARMDYLQKFYL